MLQKLILLLNLSEVEATVKDGLLNLLLDTAAQKVVAAVGTSTLPTSLEWVVIELAVKRFNKLGSEGVASESVEGISKTYEGSADELAPYMDFILAAKPIAAPSKFRFI